MKNGISLVITWFLPLAIGVVGVHVITMIMRFSRSASLRVVLTIFCCGLCVVQGYLDSLNKEANELIDGLVATVTPKNGNTNWKLHKFGGEEKRAVCLDGSPAGFWFSEGTGEGKNRYVIHHMGGGWCSSVDDCLRRSEQKSSGGSVALGSSKDWKEHVTCKASSPFTDEKSENMDQFGKPTEEKGKPTEETYRGESACACAHFSFPSFSSSPFPFILSFF